MIYIYPMVFTLNERIVKFEHRKIKLANVSQKVKNKLIVWN